MLPDHSFRAVRRGEDDDREAAAGSQERGWILGIGDHESAAQSIAAQLKLDGYHSGVTPEGKQQLVREHQQRGEVVAFAGDGINDAPALALASVGIAMGTGTDVAMHSAGLVLVKGDLAALVRAVHLSRATLANIEMMARAAAT